MKVIVVTDYAYQFGGLSTVALTGAIGIADLGVEVHLFSAVGPVEKELLNHKYIHCHCLEQYDILGDPSRMRAMLQGMWNFTAAKKFRELLQNFDTRDTIIHFHGGSKALSSSVINVANELHFKSIYHLHDYAIVCPNMGFYNFVDQKICKERPMSFQCIIKNCDSRSSYHKWWRCIRQIIQEKMGGLPANVNNFLSVSKFSYAILQQYLPEKSHVYFANNPINVEKRDAVDIVNNKFYLFVGRLVKEKDPLIFAKVANELGLQAVFVGDGDLADEIKNICPNAIITGWVGREEINYYYSKAKVLVFPSKWYETQGLVVPEAAAHGVPSIVASECAATDYVEDGINGMIFQTGNINSLKEKLYDIANNKEVLKQLGDAAYKKYWSCPATRELYSAQLMEIYNKLIK